MYKLTPDIKTVRRLSDGVCIPFEPANTDYQEYLKWIDGYEKQFNRETLVTEWVKTSSGNTPEPADE